ncbi:MAG: response regulator [Patescibacteria group bacterium]
MQKLLDRVLLIEDDPDQVHIYKTLFDLDDSVDLMIATNGQDGLAIAKAGEPDIILLDLVMAEMDGGQVLKFLKKDKDTKDVPVVILSNLYEEGIKDKYIKKGAIDYWLKTEIMPGQALVKIKEILHQIRIE